MAKSITFNDRDASFIQSALNAFFHQANDRLTQKLEPLGDIEREQLEHQKQRSKELIEQIENQ